MISIGDLAQDFTLRARQAAVKQTVQTRAHEITTGITSDVAAHLKGNLGALAALERTQASYDAFLGSAREATLHAETQQRILDQMRTSATTLATDMLSSHMKTSASAVRAISDASGQAFREVVSGLNAQVAGNALFAGIATDGTALRSADELLDDMSQALVGVSDIADLQTRLDAWFDDPGGAFETFGYIGSSTALAPREIGESATVDLSLKAEDAVFRQVLKGHALAYFASYSDLDMSTADRGGLLDMAGGALLAASSSLTDAQTLLGAREERLAQTISRNQAEISALDIARSNLISIDPYEAATALESAQFQLESLYAVTARMSRLSLADYL